MEAIVIWIVFTFFFFVILYNVIRNALDNSKLTRDVEEIKQLLKAQQGAPPNPYIRGAESSGIGEFMMSSTACEACGEPVLSDAKFCPNCGLKLAD